MALTKTETVEGKLSRNAYGEYYIRDADSRMTVLSAEQYATLTMVAPPEPPTSSVRGDGIGNYYKRESDGWHQLVPAGTTHRWQDIYKCEAAYRYVPDLTRFSGSLSKPFTLKMTHSNYPAANLCFRQEGEDLQVAFGFGSAYRGVDKYEARELAFRILKATGGL